MDKVERNVHSGVESSSEREMAAYCESGMELEGDGFETISHNKHIISRKEPSKSPRCQPHKHPFTAPMPILLGDILACQSMYLLSTVH